MVNQTVTTENVAKYRHYRATLQRCKRMAKQQYYHKQCTDLKNNTRKLWQLINNMINKTTNKMHVIDCLKSDKGLITDTIKIANEFGKYFATVGKNFASKIEKSKTDADSYIRKIE